MRSIDMVGPKSKDDIQISLLSKISKPAQSSQMGSEKTDPGTDTNALQKQKNYQLRDQTEMRPIGRAGPKSKDDRRSVH